MSLDTSTLSGRIAGAPISWGVCEVPGWGEMLRPERVLPEMRSLGLTTTELGAPGFLPDDAVELAAVLHEQGMGLLGGFVPLVLHDPAQRAAMLASAEETARKFAEHGATRFVTAVVQDLDWSTPVPLDAAGMATLGEGLAQVDAVCARYGLTQVLHPHVGTLVETKADIELALAHTDVTWCLDTGHLYIGGVDPVTFARDHADRVGLVHLKDVNAAVADRLMAGELTLIQAVQADLFTPLGEGDVAVGDAIVALEQAGYTGWYILEQDTALTDGVPEPGTGPVDDVRRSLEYLSSQVAPRIPAR
jgi:inosose dehydratase